MTGCVIRLSDLKPTPWKNGGGITTEISAHPVGSDVETFDWRISMASVAKSGPFSLFPGIERTLTVIEGIGLVLDVAAHGTKVLDARSPPLTFPGDVPTSATLQNGPIVDLNVMTRRGRATHAVERITIDEGAPSTLIVPARTTLALFCVSGLPQVEWDGAIFSLDPRDTFVVSNVGSSMISASGAATLVSVRISVA
jgi:uncharacterized protein